MKSKKSRGRVSKVSTAPYAQSINIRSGIPIIKQVGPGRIQVSHREVLQKVTGSVLFDNDSYSINPGLVTTCPWLAQIAKDYESYTFKKLVFSYVPTCSAATSGTITMACDFDSADAPALSVTDLMGYNGSSTDAPWRPQDINCSSMNLTKLTSQRLNRYGNLAANLDIKTYDVCTFQFAREGFVGTDACGYMFMDYVVEFQTPQLLLRGDVWQMSSTTAALDQPFAVITAQDGIIVSNVDNDECVFNTSGNFFIESRGTGTVAVDAYPVLDIGGVAANQIHTGQNAAATYKVSFWYMNGVKKGDLLHLDYTGSMNTLSANKIYVIRKD